MGKKSPLYVFSSVAIYKPQFTQKSLSNCSIDQLDTNLKRNCVDSYLNHFILTAKIHQTAENVTTSSEIN